VVGGTDDPGLAGDRSSTLAQRMPSAEIRLDPRLSHFCHVQQTPALADLVTDFLDRHHLSIHAEEH
jgi:pimeloyl-ACP methyl ester carboxylesterase